MTYEFHNLSTPLAPTDSSSWAFGDGTNSNAANPVHTYTHGGTYQVCLIVKKYPWPNSTPCIKYICKTVVVQEPCNIVANFTWHADSLNAQHIYFTNTSTGINTADTIRWTFGDGTSSSLFSPDHTYAQPGTYTVCLRIARMRPAGSQPCVSEICKTVVVTSNCNFTPAWSWQLSTSNPLQVNFTNLTPAPSASASAIWFFGDGTSANTWNATHVYTHSGRYYVCLRVELSPNCVRYKCDSITVPEPCNIVANFIWHPDTLNAQHIFFTNTSTGINTADTIRWTFGDGTSSTIFSPDHTYSQPGTYTVCLRIARMRPAGSQPCVSEICKTVVVTSNCNFTPAWSWQLSATNPLQVNFTNLTPAPSATASAIWIFGDGTTANTWNATHVYAQPGRYYVCLRVQLSPNCIRYKCDSITIPVPPPPCNNQSNFSVLTTSTNSQTFTFVPAYQNPAAVYTWTFGDGTGSHDMIATHHYASAGVYTACLTVWRSSTCASTTCKTVQVSAQPNCDSVHVYYTFQRDPLLPNKYYFVANSNFPILDQTWTIQKLPTGTTITLHQNNPSYIFPDTGYYRVCLRAVTLGGCVKEYCTTIHIEQVGGTNACTLTAYPNPAVTVVNVNVVLTQPDMINAYLYNSLNVLVMTQSQQGVTGNNLMTFNVAGLVPGMYTIKFIYGNHICYTQFQKVN